MRLGDLDALSAFVGDLRSTLHKEQSTFKAMTQSEFEIKDNMYLNFQYVIDNAPPVEITEEQAIDKLHETGWMQKHDKEMTVRPKGKWLFVDDDVGWEKCSICGFMSCYKRNFCPDCGADMKGGEG